MAISASGNTMTSKISIRTTWAYCGWFDFTENGYTHGPPATALTQLFIFHALKFSIRFNCFQPVRPTNAIGVVASDHIMQSNENPFSDNKIIVIIHIIIIINVIRFGGPTASNVYKSRADGSFNATLTLAMNYFTKNRSLHQFGVLTLVVRSSHSLRNIHTESEFMNKLRLFVMDEKVVHA